MTLRSCITPLVAVALAGCAGPQRLHKNLPSREAVAELAAKPPPAVVSGDRNREVPDWELAGPFPESVGHGPHTAESQWDQEFLALLPTKAPQLRASADMQCAAREAARYALEHKGTPSQPLADFLFARCGSPTSGGRLHLFHGEVPTEVGDAEIFERWRTDLPAPLASIGGSGSEFAGIAFARKGTRAVVVLAYGKDGALLEPLPVMPSEGGVFKVRGTVREPAKFIFADINRGAFGYSACEPDLSINPPAFSFTCRGDPADALAWLELSVLPPERLLGHVVARVLVSPSGAPTSAFSAARFERPTIGASFAERFAAVVNQVRTHAGMKQLALAPAQCETAARLAPHFFAALEKETRDEQAVDVIALGMMAGWDVGGEGMIRSGSFNSTWTYGSEVTDLVASMLTYPSGREALLNPDARTLAVGELTDSAGTMVGAMTSTYQYLEPAPMQEEAARVLKNLNARREALGLAKATWTAGPRNAEQKAAGMLEEGSSPDDAAGFLLQEVAEATRAQVSGWTLSTSSLDRLEFPNELVTTPNLAIIISVGHYKAPGDPWGAYVVLMATPDVTRVRPLITAQADVPGSEGR